VDQQIGVAGVNHQELATWYPGVTSHFDTLAPEMFDLNIPVSSLTVSALQFDTDRAPFVVKNPGFGSQAGVVIAREVPWRGSTSTRTATRAELLLLLAPLLKLPRLELLSGELTARPSQDAQQVMWDLALELYVVPAVEGRIVIPKHRCSASFEIAGQTGRASLNNIHLHPPYSINYTGGRHVEMTMHSKTIQSTQYEAIVDGPGVLRLGASASTQGVPDNLKSAGAQITVALWPAGADAAAPLDMVLGPTPLTDLEPDGDGHGGNDRELLAKWTGSAP
jgi:hypothetical protein